MKIRIELQKDLNETEVVIRCRELDEEVMRIQQSLSKLSDSKIALVRDDKEFFLSMNTILFFEAVDGKTYAHSSEHIFTSKYRLYELENLLPKYFVRISKSAIVNTNRIISITRNLTGPSLIRFKGSHKQISVSRSYYKGLRSKLVERS